MRVNCVRASFPTGMEKTEFAKSGAAYLVTEALLISLTKVTTLSIAAAIRGNAWLSLVVNSHSQDAFRVCQCWT